MPDRMSKYMSDRLPHSMPEQNICQIRSQNIYIYLFIYLDLFMPDRMPEYRSDKLLEYKEYMSKYKS